MSLEVGILMLLWRIWSEQRRFRMNLGSNVLLM
jgi:hypothetical protein